MDSGYKNTYSEEFFIKEEAEDNDVDFFDTNSYCFESSELNDEMEADQMVNYTVIKDIKCEIESDKEENIEGVDSKLDCDNIRRSVRTIRPSSKYQDIQLFHHSVATKSSKTIKKNTYRQRHEMFSKCDVCGTLLGSRAIGHTECRKHAPCYNSAGYWDPDACEICSRLVAKVRNSDPIALKTIKLWCVGFRRISKYFFPSEEIHLLLFPGAHSNKELASKRAVSSSSDVDPVFAVSNNCLSANKSFKRSKLESDYCAAPVPSSASSLPSKFKPTLDVISKNILKSVSTMWDSKLSALLEPSCSKIDSNSKNLQFFPHLTAVIPKVIDKDIDDESSESFTVKSEVGNPWMPCLSMCINGNFLVCPKYQKQINLDLIEFSNRAAFPNCNYRIKLSAVKTYPSSNKNKCEMVLHKACSITLNRTNNEENESINAMTHDVCPFASKVMSLVCNDLEYYLNADVIDKIEEGKELFSTALNNFSISIFDIVSIFKCLSDVKLYPSIAQEEFRDNGFPILYDGFIKREHEKRKVFLASLKSFILLDHAITNMNENIAHLPNTLEDINMKLFPVVLTTLYDFVEAKLALRKEVFEGYDLCSVRVKRLLCSNLFSDKLFDARTINIVQKEATSTSDSVTSYLMEGK